MANDQPRTNKQRILQAILDMTEHAQPASRQRVIEETGIKAAIVDETIKVLRNDGLIRVVANGYYEYIDQAIDRPVSTTSLPHGRMKLEIGDDVVADLTPREALALAKQLSGLLLAFGAYSWGLSLAAERHTPT